MKCVYILVVLQKNTVTCEYEARNVVSGFTLMKKATLQQHLLFCYVCVSVCDCLCVFQHCTEQVERLAECEKAILQMKSELERQ